MGGLYAYPGYPALPSQTEKGLRSLSQTMIVFLVVDVLGVVLLLAVLPIIALGLTNPSDPALIAAAFSLIAVVCVLLIVIVIGLILGLIGLLAVHKGRDEFGPAHAQKIDHGLIVLIIGIIIPGIISGIGGSVGGLSVTPRIDVVSAASQLVAGLLGSLLVGLFLLWTIEALATPDIRQRGMIALVLGIVSGVSGGAASLVVAYAVQPPTTATDLAQFIPFVIPSIISASISIVSLVVWYMTYRAVLDRFKRGELRAAPPAMMYPPPYPPPYYPYQPPYVPQAPPPAPPPQEPPPANPPPNP